MAHRFPEPQVGVVFFYIYIYIEGKKKKKKMLEGRSGRSCQLEALALGVVAHGACR